VKPLYDKIHWNVIAMLVLSLIPVSTVYWRESPPTSSSRVEYSYPAGYPGSFPAPIKTPERTRSITAVSDPASSAHVIGGGQPMGSALSDCKALFKEGRYREAEHGARQESIRDRGNAENRVLLGASLGAQGKFEQAKDEFEAVLAIAPNHYDALVGLAKSLHALGNLERAESTWMEAIRARKGDYQCWSGLGLTQLAKGQQEKANASMQFAEALRSGRLLTISSPNR
jgi:Flp pilus assembly protein TadD